MDDPVNSLGDAVRIHARRVRRIQRGHERLRQAAQNPDVANSIIINNVRARLGASDVDEFCARYFTFAGSYGIPDKDGVPTTQVRTLEGQNGLGREQIPTTTKSFMHAAELGNWLATRERTAVTTATTMYVGKDIVREVAEAAGQMEPEPIFGTDPPVVKGMAVFEEPIQVPDIHPDTGEPCPTLFTGIRAIAWAPEAMGSLQDLTPVPGITLFCYTTGYDHETVYRPSLEVSGIEDIGPHGWLDRADAYNLHGERIEVATDPRYMENFMLSDVIPWRYGVEWRERDHIQYEEGSVPTQQGYVRRWFLALMRLTWQEHIRVEREGTRRDRKAWRRDMPEGEFCVLRLRHVRYADGPDRDLHDAVELAYRTTVRGHWRRQYYPSLGGPARLEDGRMNARNHRLVWVEEHIRGDHDLPLYDPTKVISVVE